MKEAEKHPIEATQDRSFFRRKDADRKIPPLRKRLPYPQVIHLGICLVIILLQIVLLTKPIFERFEYVFLDHFFSARGKILTDPSIAVIEIAEDGLEAIGRWPWPRHYHAVMAHLLSQWGARAVVFDILFSEKSTDFDDGALAEAIESSKNVYLPVVLEGEGKKRRWIENLDSLSAHARGIGAINVVPDADGKIRRIEPFETYQGRKIPHLALRVAADLEGKTPEEIVDSIPLDEKGDMMINWAGRWSETFEHYSFVDLLQSFEAVKSGEKPRIPKDTLKGKICFIGLTAFGQTDIKPNPMESLYPALGLHANVLNGILIGESVHPAPLYLNAIAMFLVGALASLMFVLFRSVRSFLGGLALGGIWMLLAYYFFKNYGVFFFVFHELVLIFSLYVFSTVYAMILQNKERLGLLFLATRDGLTGLYVIRHFRHLLNAAVFEAAAKKKNLAVILIDVDHFKRINDTYGHQAGDAVLREIAVIVQNIVKNMRPKMGDVVARYGGEEMIIFLRQCSLKEAAENVAERIRFAVSDAVIHHKGLRISVTISLGVSDLHPSEHIPDLMVSRADKALYAAKDSGRNRVCFRDFEPEEPASGAPPEKMVI